MICPKCTNDIPDNAKFCPDCGAAQANTGETTRIGQPARIPVTGATTRLQSDPTVRHEQGYARILRIGKMFADITITENSSLSAIQLSLSGDPTMLQQFLLMNNNDELIISCPIPFKGGNILAFARAITSSNTQNITIEGKEVDFNKKIQCEIEVPTGTSIIFEEFYCDLNVGELTGSMTLKYFGSDDLYLGNLGNLSLEVNGVGHVTVDDVTGTLEAKLNSFGNLEISDGNVTSLKLVMNGAGNFTYNGYTSDAILELHGNGNVSIGDISGDIEVYNYGSGDVETGTISGNLKVLNTSIGGFTVIDGNVDTLSMENRGSSDITYGGNALNALLTVKSNGSIEVQEITEALTVENVGSGNITVQDMDVNNLSATLGSNGEIILSGRATNGTFRNYGSSDIAIDEVYGTVTIEVKSVGGVSIQDGEIQTLRANNSGSGDISVSATVEDAELTLTSIGGIEIYDVTNSLSAVNKGSGDIGIQDGSVQHIHAELHSIGGITFNGEAEDAELYNFGSGDITVGDCTGTVKTQRTSIGEIYIG